MGINPSRSSLIYHTKISLLSSQHSRSAALQKELLLGALDESRLAHPLVLSELRVEGSLLQVLQLEREARAQLLQTRAHLVLVLAVDVAVVAHENEVSLVVECDDLAAFELGLLREKEREKE